MPAVTAPALHLPRKLWTEANAEFMSDPVLGCVSTADDTLCDDGIPCTTDACSAERKLQFYSMTAPVRMKRNVSRLRAMANWVAFPRKFRSVRRWTRAPSMCVREMAPARIRKMIRQR